MAARAFEMLHIDVAFFLLALSLRRKPKVRQAAIDWLLRDSADFPLICELGPPDRIQLNPSGATQKRAHYLRVVG
jgi:hypothetical protein